MMIQGSKDPFHIKTNRPQKKYPGALSNTYRKDKVPQVGMWAVRLSGPKHTTAFTSWPVPPRLEQG